MAEAGTVKVDISQVRKQAIRLQCLELTIKHLEGYGVGTSPVPESKLISHAAALEKYVLEGEQSNNVGQERKRG